MVQSPGSKVQGPVLVLLIMLSGPALAQGRVEVAVGAVLEGGAAAGTTRAELLNGAGIPVTLFDARHRTTSEIGLEAHLSLRVSQRWALGASGSWSTPHLVTRVTSDVESTPDMTASLGMHRITAELGLARRFSRRGRWDPYLRVSAGWLRELTTDRTLVADGVAAHVGGGLKYWMRDGRPGWLGRLALRADVHLALRRGGLTLGEAGIRLAPAVSAGFVIAR